MGKFSTDRCMREYAKDIWMIDPCERPPPDEFQRMRSFANDNTSKISGTVASFSDSDAETDRWSREEGQRKVLLLNTGTGVGFWCKCQNVPLALPVQDTLEERIAGEYCGTYRGLVCSHQSVTADAHLKVILRQKQ